MNRLYGGHSGQRSKHVGGSGRLPRTVLGTVLVVGGIAVGLTTNPSPAGAVFPGSNGRIFCEGLRGAVIAGDSRSEIFSVNPDGSDERRLTDNVTRNGAPAISPDGTKIAFEGRRDETQLDNSDIYVADNDGDLAGPDVKRLTSNNGQLSNGTRNAIAATDTAPSWSPDGTQIVFHSGRETTFSDGGPTPVRDFEVYKMNATTGETVQPAQRLTNSRGQDAIPSWSPDGTKIAFQRLYQTGNPLFDPLRTVNLEIWTMNPDGSGQTNVSNSPGTANDPATPANENSNGLDRDVIWSPNSAQLAFSSTRSNVTPGNQNFEVFKMNRDGSNQTRLTTNASGDTPDTDGDYDAPNTWSPDGKRILFTTGRSSTADESNFVGFTMDASSGEAAGLQRVAETAQFARCDWQAVAPASTPPGGGGGYPLPPGGGGSGGGGGIVCPAGNSAGVRCTGRTKSGGLVIVGTNGDDTIVGTGKGDRITGGGGRDTIRGGGGNDSISGGSGSDRISGGSGSDSITGGSGNDRINGDSGNDRVNGNSGNDRISGGSGNDRLSGSSGNDTISGGSGKDRLAGGSGSDRLNGNSGNDSLRGDSGKDRLSGSSGNDRLSGGSGKDKLSGGSGKNKVKQ